MSEEENQPNPFQGPPPPPQPPASQNKLEALSNSVGFDIPVESVPLPSRGLVYPIDNVLSNEERVDIRAMSAKQEDILTSRALIKNGTVITHLLQSCLLNKAVDVDQMLTGDRNAVLIAIRVTGYGSEYKVKVSCPDCDEESDYEFSLARLKVKSLGANPVYPNTNLFEYTLPKSGLQMQFRLFTGADEAELSRMADRRRKLGSQVDEVVTSRLFAATVAVNGVTDRQKIKKITDNLMAYDAKAYRKYMTDIEPGVEMKQEFVCSRCTAESEVDVPLGTTFFWPDVG